MRLVRSSLDGEDHGFCLGIVAVQCSGAEYEALRRLPDVYHPLLDVYEARTITGAGGEGEGEMVQLRVQVARRDAASLELLLRRRVHELVAWQEGDSARHQSCWGSHAGV